MAPKGSYLATDSYLQCGDYLLSANGQYAAYLKDDGNLVLVYTNDAEPLAPDLTRVYWSAIDNPPGGPASAIMQDDGNLVLYPGAPSGGSAPSDAYWSSDTCLGEDSYTTVLQDDGNLVVFRGNDTSKVGEPCWSALPLVTVQCKFMQNYREASPVNGGKDLVAVRNGDGDVVLFTIGTDGNVHAFVPDRSNELGYREALVGPQSLPFDTLAGGLDSQGKIFLLAATYPNPALYYMTETGDPSAPWSDPKIVTDFPLPSDTKKIASIRIQNIASKPYAAITIVTNANLYYVKMATWDTYPMTFTALEGDFAIDPACVFHGNTTGQVRLAAFAPVSDPSPALSKVLFYPVGGGATTSASLGSNQAIISSTTALDPSGTNQTFAVLKDGHVYRLQDTTAQTGGPSYSWTPLWQQDPNSDAIPASFLDVATEVDGAGAVHLFAASTQKIIEKDGTDLYREIYHWSPDTSSSTGYVVPPIPIYKSSGLSFVTVDNHRQPLQIMVVDSANAIFDMYQEEGSSAWNVQAVEIDDAGADIVDYASYATEVTVLDSRGAAMPDAKVRILSTEQTRITVNGSTYFIDDTRWIDVPTNSSGMLSIAQETSALASPVLQLSLQDTPWPNAPSIVVSPFVDVEDALANTTAQQLMDATMVVDKDGDTEPLLQGAYATQDNANSLAKALQDIMSDVAPPSRLDSTPNSRRRHRFWTRSAAPLSQLRRISPHKKPRSWQLSFDGSNVTYKSLTPEEAKALQAERTATLPSLASSAAGSWWRKIGDLVQAAVSGIAQIKDVIVTGINAAITLMIDGLEYVFNSIVEFIEDAFNMVELVFARVKVFFEQLYQWLALLFGWDDIRRTRRAVSYAVDQMLGFLQLSASGLKPIIGNFFGYMQDALPSMVQQAEGVVGDRSVGGYEQKSAEPNPDYELAVSNNFFYNEFSTNAGGSGDAEHPLRAKLVGDKADDFVTQLLAFGNAVENLPTWNAMVNAFKDLGTEPDKLFTVKLPNLMNAVRDLVVQALQVGMQTLLNSLLDIAASAVKSLRDAMAEDWNIPFVSKFYKWVTGDPLNANNLMSLLVAIPATVLHKLIFKKSPFPDEASLEAFMESFTASSMAQSFGFPGSTALTSTRSAVSPDGLKALASIYCVSSLMGAFFSAQVDSTDPTIAASWRWRIPNYLCTAGALVGSFEPFWGPVGSDVQTVQGTIGWYYMLNSLAFLGAFGTDIYEQWQEGEQAEKSDMVTLLMLFKGIMMMSLAGVSAGLSNETNAKKAWRIINCLPSFLQPLRFSIVSLGTNRKSLVGLAIGDLTLGLTAGSLGSYVFISSAQETRATA